MIPQDIEQALVYVVYVFIAVIIFLWGKAIGTNETTEAYKRQDTKSEVMKLRRENAHLKSKNIELMSKMKLYLNTFSGFRNLIKKAELL